MSVEGATYISQLDPTNPPGGGPISEGDNHLRLVKSTLVVSFPNFGTTAMLASAVELNYVVGVTSLIQAQIDSKAPLASPVLTGTPTAPTATLGANTLQLANAAFVNASLASVNAAAGDLARSTNAAASFAIAAGQMIAATNAAQVAVTFPAAPAVGTVCGAFFENNRTDNTVDLGANGVKGVNGVVVTGVVTVDDKQPVVLGWFGDYWRPA